MVMFFYRRFTKVNDLSKYNGDGWKLISEEEASSTSNNPFLELKEKYTIIIVTHNMQQAVRIADKTAFFLLGEVIEFSDTETMFSTPKDKRTEDYITGRFG